mmetsp:Transcript_25707/g.73968  ORF Transcript_25707/g.73968 Transcript_25707/m.73968 type:complete len:88 (+) Transcript_25707:75-338(+)
MQPLLIFGLVFHGQSQHLKRDRRRTQWQINFSVGGKGKTTKRMLGMSFMDILASLEGHMSSKLFFGFVLMTCTKELLNMETLRIPHP